MINNKLVFAKINRPESIIAFKKKKNENDNLNEWRYDIHRILDLVDSTANLIGREYDIIPQNVTAWEKRKVLNLNYWIHWFKTVL